MFAWLQLESLKFAHEKGFVYQDLKPANVMFGRGDHLNDVYLVDWGCCRTYLDFKGSLLTAPGGGAGNDTFRSLHSHACERELALLV